MDPLLRPARPDDEAAILAFTQDTFPWGDYVGRVFGEWLADPEALNLVAEAEGEVVGFARGSLLSSAEAWTQGLRVHPDHRRRGIGAALVGRILAWAGARGARVIRLSTEDWNEPARALFAAVGFRTAGAWSMAERPMGAGSPLPSGNGGKRVPVAERLTPALAGEAGAAMLAWASAHLDQAAHELFPIGWCWRRLTLDDLEAAARRRAFWQGRPGWALAEVEDDTFRVSWLACYPEEAGVAARALFDLAAKAAVDRIEVMLPAVEWLSREFETRGCQIHPLTVYARPL